MFDISFAELMMIAVVMLLVVGPDKLPQLARTAGAFIGRLQRYVAQVKEEMNRDDRFQALQNLQQEIKQGASQAESSIMADVSEVEATVSGTDKSIKPKKKSTTKAKAASKKPVNKKAVVKKPAVKKAKPKKAKAQA